MFSTDKVTRREIQPVKYVGINKLQKLTHSQPLAEALQSGVTAGLHRRTASNPLMPTAAIWIRL